MDRRHSTRRYSARKPGLRRCSKQLHADCRKRKGWWPLDGFDREKNTTNSDGLHSQCKTCRREISRQWKRRNRERCRENLRKWQRENPERRYELRAAHYAAHKEEAKAYRRAWRKTHPIEHRSQSREYRLRKLGLGRLTDADWAEVIAKYGDRCLCCGTRKRITVDHVVPLSKGGANAKHNVQPLCLPCNSRKHQKTIDYRPDRGRHWRK